MTAEVGPAPGIVPRWLWLLGLLFAILTTAQAIGVAYMGSGWAAPRGSTGINVLADCTTDRFCAITRVRAGSPAARAGIAPGDRLRLDRYWERRRTLAPGDPVGATIRRGGTERHVDLIAEPRPFSAPVLLVGGLSDAVALLIALLILARAGRRWPSFLLGCALTSINLPGGYPRFWENAPALFPWFFLGLSIVYMSGPALLLAALRGFRREMIGRSPRWLDRLIVVVILGLAAATILGGALNMNGAPLFGITDDLLPTSIAWALGTLLGPVALADGWHMVPAANRTRYAFLWAAISVVSLGPIVDPVIILTGSAFIDESWPVIIQLVSTILGALLFAYAILRHRVIDLGFAINRTLVYSTLSFLTLVTFGLFEWASEKLLPFESHEASVLIEAAIALVLFLVFHRIHAAIEKLVERVFFHHWHVNEAALRRFLNQASYVTRADVLIERTIEELRRFCGGADVAFYRTAAGGYERIAGESAGPTLVDADAPALVALRAERIVVHDIFAGGDLALPMLHRAEVTGFLVAGAKPDGDPYRRDEEALLAEAAGRIGLDLFAFRVEELERANAVLTAQLRGFDARQAG